jgi:hypothetical protein
MPMQTVTTDSAGRVVLRGLALGNALVTARKIGFKPGALRAILGPGENTLPLLLDAAIVPTLAEVRILGGREVLARHSEFEGRRSRGLASASFTEADIRKRNPVDTWQMFTGLPFVKVNAEGVAQSTRAATGGAGTRCYMNLAVNGLVITGRGGGPAPLDVLPSPAEIHGIEVFAGPAMVPPQYNRLSNSSALSGISTCGLIIVWTK